MDLKIEGTGSAGDGVTPALSVWHWAVLPAHLSSQALGIFSPGERYENRDAEETEGPTDAVAHLKMGSHPTI